MRFADGLSRRANSVNARPDAAGDADAVITACEQHYHAAGLPAIFRILSFADPAMKDRLAARGYTAEGESVVLSADIHDVFSEPDANVELSLESKTGWLSAMSKLQKHTDEKRKTYRKIIKSISVPAAYATVRHKRRPVSLAYAVIHDKLLCFESVFTDEEMRRQGHARRMMAALVAWARAEGAEAVCLQVEAANEPAVKLYKGLGLKEVYRYHYRREPARS